MAEPAVSTPVIDGFFRRWKASGVAERANYSMYLNELCDVLDVPRPEPADADDELNAYGWPQDLSDEEILRLADLKAQAVRAVLADQPSGLTPDQLARLFLRANTQRVTDMLNTLVSLGQARALEVGAIRLLWDIEQACPQMTASFPSSDSR